MSDEMSAIFREELRDLLESLEKGLLDLKSQPTDMGLVNQVFRDLHTVKGSGAMFGFTELAAFIHEFETVFDRVRAGVLPVGPEILRLALAAKDEIPGLVDNEPDPDGRRDAILAALVGLMTAGQAPAPEAAGEAEAVDAGSDPAPDMPAASEVSGPSTLRFRLSAGAFSMGARPEILLDELRGLGATEIVADLADLPSLDRLDVEDCWIGWSMSLPAEIGSDQLEEVFMFVDADWTLVPAVTDTAETPQPQQATDTAPPDEARREVPVAPPAARMADPVEATPEAFHNMGALNAPARDNRADAAGATVRVPAERLDALMDAVGELVILEARLTELARENRDPALITTAEQITRLAAGLRDATMTMRMVPIRSLVARFRRLVLDLSDKLAKPVEFSVLGEDTKLDKTVIEKLADPLVHILRNAIDHGMETQDERSGTAKEHVGLIELSAEHAGAEVLIRVRDDGRGMDPARIRAKAVAQGLISADAVLTESQIYALVFEPGFSTAEKVTELSGRGVGMDVVRRTIESLRGSLEIESKMGHGTTVTLRLPLTLAIIEGLLIEVAGERYTLPMASVQEIVELPAEKAQPKKSGDFLDIRGRFVPFLRLRAMFDCAGQPGPEQNVVIVMSGENRVGLVVDRIVGTNQTVIKQMSKLHASVRAVSGATILGDGSVALILDVAHLVGMGRTQHDPQTREVAA
jgi:two-component system, chemotaxis family, sensor kinase CheA